MMTNTGTLRTLITAPDLLVMPGIFDGSVHVWSNRRVSGGFISGGA